MDEYESDAALPKVKSPNFLKLLSQTQFRKFSI